MINVYEWLGFEIKLFCILTRTYIKCAEIKSREIGEEVTFYSGPSFIATALPRLLKASYTITLYSKFFVFVVLSDLHSNLVRQIQLHWQMTKQSLLVKDKFKVHICKLTAAGFTLQKLCHCMSSKVLFVVFLFKTLWVLKKINPSSTIYSLFFSSQI